MRGCEDGERRCHPGRAQRAEGSAPDSGNRLTRRTRKIPEGTENRSPGRAPCTRAPLLSIHAIEVFDGPAEKSLPHTERSAVIRLLPRQSALPPLGREQKRPPRE